VTAGVANRRTVVQVVATGSFGGQGDLLAALDAPGSSVDVVVWTPEVRDVLPQLASGGAEAVLIGAPADLSHVAATLAQDVATIRRHARVPVILLVPEADPDAVEAALGAGVDDVLVMPLAAETIAFAIGKAKRAAGRGPGLHGGDDVARGKVVTVFSPKGGTGKTVLSTNLAALLASQGDKKVLLIDLDLQFGDAAIMLGLDPTHTMHDLVQSPGELDPGKLGGFVMHHKSGLDVLAAPMRPEQAEIVTEAKVMRLLEVAAEAYDVVVVDTSPFFYGPMLALLQPTDRLLMLCGLDVPTLKNVKLSLRTLDLLGFPLDRVELVLNRVTPKVGLEPRDVEEALGIPVSYEIPNDPVVAPAVNRGAAAAILDSDSEFAHAVGVIAGTVETGHAPVRHPEPETSKRRWFGRMVEGRAS
jgi:pilus assembly protein CpaE